MKRRRGAGVTIIAHVVMLALCASLAVLAWRTGYPNLGSLAAIIAVGAIILFEVSTRLHQARTGIRFWRVCRAYGAVIGMVCFYLLTDAHVLEQAKIAYPATAMWLIGFIGSVALLALAMSLRQPDRTDMFVLEPRFTGNGIGIFVVAVCMQLFVMTAITPLEFNIIAFRLTCFAASIWFVKFGTILRSRSVLTGATVFTLLNVLTAYLDLLWPFRDTIPFMIGAGILALVTLAVLRWWIGSIDGRPVRPAA
ncbi:MAG: hypothetical protein ACE363_05785 [Alphaproteobacteria bacterium]